MGQNFSSEPVVEKETERDHNDIFNVAVSSCQGWRMSQEDNHSLMLELPGDHKAAFFAVYDGHGSAKVSKHASEGLWRHLIENEMYIKGNFKEALEGAFLTFDREVNETYNAQLAGTTAVCLLVVNNIIYCANIGDSRGVASVNCECIPLSFDHKPENPQELKRILAAGGYVLGNRVNGNLALSRAFGDFHYKGNEQLPPEHQIVSPCPDIKTIELNDDVEFLLLACDGIWDVLSSEEVVEFVISRLEQNMEPGLICEQLTTRCLATDYELVIGCDNMTVLLVCYTRGRSWVDFCTDIFNKNTRKLEVPRTRPTIEERSSETVEREAGHFDKLNENNAKEFYDLLNVLKSEIDTGTEDSSSIGVETMKGSKKEENSATSLSTDESAPVQVTSFALVGSSMCQKDENIAKQSTEDKQSEQQDCIIKDEHNDDIKLENNRACQNESHSEDKLTDITKECKSDNTIIIQNDPETKNSKEISELKSEQLEDSASTSSKVELES